MRNEGENRRLPECTFLMRPRIICSQALKSAITPSRSGRITRILLFVFSYMRLASSPTAIIFSLCVSSATTEGSFTAISPSEIMMVLAVPRSMANSCVKEKNFENIPMCPIIFQTNYGLRYRNGCSRRKRVLRTNDGLREWFVHRFC